MKPFEFKRLTFLILTGLLSATHISTVGASIQNEIHKLLATDGSALDDFGVSVAIQGETALVGASQDDDVGFLSGSVYVFTRREGVWTEEQKLTASDGAPFNRFGSSLSISGDTALIGASGDFEKPGSVYEFVRKNGMWTEQQKITPSDGTTNDRFGNSVSIDGDTALIGAVLNGEQGENAGSAYVFVRGGGVWVEQQKLTASDGASNDLFGTSVSVAGNTALIGASQDSDDARGLNSGSVYAFERNGGVWTEEQKLTASDGASTDLFGSSVSINGTTALIGASQDNDDTLGINSGSAYVFENIEGIWTERQKLTASDGSSTDVFGTRVVVEGNKALIGAVLDDGSGSVYFFANNEGEWVEQQKLVPSDATDNGLFGVALSIDGNNALIGAFQNDGRESTSGAAYVFSLAESDTDSDGYPDYEDNCPNDFNSDQADFDGDGLGDVCDTDDDNDGISDESDPDRITDAVRNLPLSSFSSPKGKRNALLKRLNKIEKKILNKKTKIAKKQLSSILGKLDGCGNKPDNNDWIVHCADQIQIRDLVSDIRDSL